MTVEVYGKNGLRARGDSRLDLALQGFAGRGAGIKEDVPAPQYRLYITETSRREALLQLGHAGIRRADTAKKSSKGSGATQANAPLNNTNKRPQAFSACSWL